MTSVDSPRPRTRIDLIDVARGLAMLLVFVSHFLEAFYDPFPNHPQGYKILTRIATPAFVCVSGLTLAVLFSRHRDRFGPTRDRLIDRGLFLILIGHPLFVGSFLFMQPTWQDALRVVFVTDTIGFCVIAGALLITRLGPRSRLLLGIALLAAAWIGVAAWNPPIPSLGWRLKDFLVGDWREPWLTYNFPPVPWFGLYLVGSAVGSGFARAYEDGSDDVLATLAMQIGIALVLTGAAVHFGLRALLRSGAFPGQAGPVAHFANPLDKLPPSPTYVLTYVGCVALMLAGLMRSGRTKLGRKFAGAIAIFGRNSLPAFLIQSYVYFVAVRLLPRPPEILLPLYFLGTVMLLGGAVSFWERRKLNRLLTVGYPPLRRGGLTPPRAAPPPRS